MELFLVDRLKKNLDRERITVRLQQQTIQGEI